MYNCKICKKNIGWQVDFDVLYVSGSKYYKNITKKFTINHLFFV